MNREEIAEMKKTLEKEGYAVIKMTPKMQEDMDACAEEYEENGTTKDCFGCSCSICLLEDC